MARPLRKFTAHANANRFLRAYKEAVFVLDVRASKKDIWAALLRGKAIGKIEVTDT